MNLLTLKKKAIPEPYLPVGDKALLAPELLIPGEMPIARVTENRATEISACFGGARSGKSINMLTLGSTASQAHDGLIFTGSGAGSYVTINNDVTRTHTSRGTVIIVFRPNSYGEGGFGRLLYATETDGRAMDIYLRDTSAGISWRTSVYDSVTYHWTLNNFSMGDRYCFVVTNTGLGTMNAFICNLNTRYTQSVMSVEGVLFAINQQSSLKVGNRGTNDRAFDGAIEMLQVIKGDLSYLGAQIARDPYMFWNAN
jgi:hypothetical protein